MTLDEVTERPLLVYGIGNVGRQDDGLGPIFVERLGAAGVPAGVTLESAYQLAPEDALTLAAHATVLFVDASAAPGAPAPYAIEEIAPASEVSFSTHAMSMGSLLALCRRLYGRSPRAFALALPGYAFDVNAALSAEAEAGLVQALAALQASLARTV